MGRKSREQIEAETKAQESEINQKVEERFEALKQQLLAEIAPKLAEAREHLGASAAAPDPERDRNMLDQLVTGIAKLSDPHNQRRHISPAELSRREEAREKLVALLIDAQAKGEQIEYSVTQKLYLNEQLIEPAYQDTGTKQMMVTHIAWPLIPNEYMRPANEIARKVHEQFLISIGGGTEHRNTHSAFVQNGAEVLNASFVRGQRQHVPETGGTRLADIRIEARQSESDRAVQARVINVLGTAAAPGQLAANSAR